MKKGNKYKKRNNNYWVNQYSHKYARAHYNKKCPKNLREMVLEKIKSNSDGRYAITVEGISKSLQVLHKFVHQVFMKLQQEGYIVQARMVNYNSGRTIFSKNEKHHKLPISYINDAMHDGERHPKLYALKVTL